MDHQKAGVLKITGSKLKAWQQDMIIGLDDRVFPKEGDSSQFKESKALHVKAGRSV